MSMLKSKKFLKYLWGEVMNIATYILNRSLTKKVENMTLEEAWTSVKPYISHLRVFGSICYRHVPDQVRPKLDDKGDMMIMLGYHSTCGYKLLNPMNNKIIISMDVVVDEHNEWKLNDVAETEKHSLLDMSANESVDDSAQETVDVIEHVHQEGI